MAYWFRWSRKDCVAPRPGARNLAWEDRRRPALAERLWRTCFSTMASAVAGNVLLQLDFEQPVLSPPRWSVYYYDCVRKDRRVELKWLVRRRGIDLDACFQKVGNSDFPNDLKRNPMHVAVRHGYQDTLRYLIAQGCDKEVRCALSSMTPLHYAVEYQKVEAFRFLLEAGANPRATTALGETLLHLAVLNASGNDTMQYYLLKLDLPKNAVTTHGETALLYAVRYGQPNSILAHTDWLCTVGCDPNIVSKCGYSPLHYAVMADDLKLVKLLIRCGCDVHLMTAESSADCPEAQSVKRTFGEAEGRE